MVVIMYVNVAYLKDMLESYLTPVDCADDTVPLKILCCGFYRVMPKDNAIVTDRPNGRKDYQLLYFHSGQGHFCFGDQRSAEHVSENSCTTTVTAGQMVLFRPGERQLYEYYSTDRTEVYWVHFTGNAVDKILSDYGFNKKEQVFWGGTSVEYQELCRKMIKELQLCKKGYEALIAMLFQEFLLLISRNRNNPYINGTAIEQEINRALGYFQENYAMPIQIEKYAASRYLSACWFIRSFRQYIGITPLQYIISLRMNNARELLSQSYSVTEVAGMVGYEDPLYFSRLFKKHVGVTPYAPT